MRIAIVRPEYVEYVPRDLENGVLYVSTKFRTASHLCCCGCGIKIVTPLRETEYRIIDRNGLITLRPSIGNWDHPCRSHYFITNNAVEWSYQMARRDIEAARRHDDMRREQFYGKKRWPWWRRFGLAFVSWINRD